VTRVVASIYVVASEPACARSAMVALVVEPLVAALHGTEFQRVVIRLRGGEAKGRLHQGAPAPLAALALVVKEVGVHADDADPLQRPQALDLLFVLPPSALLVQRCGAVASPAAPCTSCRQK
jgi:hypothetical protein